MSTMQENQKTPNWILFVFFGALVVGLLYTIFSFAFLKQDAQSAYLSAAGIQYQKAQSTAISFEPLPEHNAKSISEGEQHYQTSCAACHSADLSGGVGPNLKDNIWLHFEDVTEENVAIQIIKGVGPGQAKSAQGGIMPPRGGSTLSNSEILKIAYYLAQKNPSIKKSNQ